MAKKKKFVKVYGERNTQSKAIAFANKIKKKNELVLLKGNKVLIINPSKVFNKKACKLCKNW